MPHEATITAKGFRHDLRHTTRSLRTAKSVKDALAVRGNTNINDALAAKHKGCTDGSHEGKLPPWEQALPVFASGGNWSLYYDGGKWIIPVSFPPGTPPRLVALFTPDFRSGDIYAKSNRNNHAPLYPLAYPLDELLMINLLSKAHGVVFHACGINQVDSGSIFAGISGAGKSTMANLWKRQNDVTLLSDDRVIVRKREGRFMVYGTPWHGDACAAAPDAAPLERIFIIRHAPENNITLLKPAEAASRLLVRSFPTFWDAEGMASTLEFLDELTRTVPCYDLGFVPDGSVVDFVRCIT